MSTNSLNLTFKNKNDPDAFEKKGITMCNMKFTFSTKKTKHELVLVLLLIDMVYPFQSKSQLNTVKQTLNQFYKA